MRLISASAQVIFLLCAASSSLAASSWGFGDATVAIQGKGGVGSTIKEKLAEHKSLSSPLALGATESLKVILTTQDGKTAKRAHQTFLLLRDPTSGLDISYPFSLKDTGKVNVDLSHKDLPTQFLHSKTPLEASLVIGSFGSSAGYNDKAFQVAIILDPSVPIASNEKPLRYGKLPEIHHIFRSDPTSPNILITIIFSAAVLATIPALLGVWFFLGGNFSHLANAMQDAPVSHGLFLGSIIGIEGVFFMYYTSWNLFQTLPVLFAIGLVALLSGSRALTEVQGRRLAGLR